MIILTGGAGFIGSNFLKKLNAEGIDDVIVVDWFDSSEKWKNLIGKEFVDYYNKDDFFRSLTNKRFGKADTIFHFGACSSTTELNGEYMIENNYSCSKKLMKWALKNDVKFIYASSAATYGDGSHGFSDANSNSLRLRPLNIYGYSKQLFDAYVIKNKLDKQVSGLKFFNVFGPNEYHKDGMRSMVYKAFQQIQSTGKISLFRSNDPAIKDGEQSRDFIYVKDCVKIVWWLFENDVKGILNVGTGQANSWLKLVRSVFRSLEKPESIEFIDMPENLIRQYQNFTQADITKLLKAGYDQGFFRLEEAVDDYVRNYLLQKNQYN